MTQEPGHSVRNRAPYLPIHKRPRLRLPNDAKIAVWTIVNVENWSPTGPMPRTVLPPPMGNPLLPDVPNWAWHEYGMRVGFWRFLETLNARNLKATFAVNGSACTLYGEACQAALDAGFLSASVEVVEETVRWESAEQMVSMFTSWWDCAARMEGVDADRRQKFAAEAIETLKRAHPGAIETTGRNHVLFAIA